MCEMQTSIQHAARADVVFAGRLLEIDEGIRGPIRSTMDPITYRFAVDQVFKGAVAQNASVVSAASGGSCGLERMNVGARYTVFAQAEAGTLRSGLCGGTHPGGPDPAVAVMSGLILPPVAGAPPGWVFLAAALAVVLMIVVGREMVRRRRQGEPATRRKSRSLARSLPRHTGVAVEPTPPPRPADDVIQDLQRSGWSRWTPRRAGVPALIDWWPAYVLVIALAVLAILVTLRLAAELLGPARARPRHRRHRVRLDVLARATRHAPRELDAAPRGGRRSSSSGRSRCCSRSPAVIAWQFSGEGQRLSNQLTQLSEALKGNATITIGPYEIPPNIQERLSALTEQGTKIDEWSAGVAIGIVTSLIDLVLVLVITFYLLLDIRRLRATCCAGWIRSHRPGARRVFSEIARVFGAYVRAQLLVALSLGVLVAAVLLALGVPYALFLALFAAMAELIPMVGPSSARCRRSSSPRRMPLPTVIWVGVAFVFIQLIESNILVPRMVGRAVGIHPVGSILALALGFQLGGVIGALFAVPLAGLLWVLVSTAVRAWRDKRIELQRTVDPTRCAAGAPGPQAPAGPRQSGLRRG